MLLVLSSSCNEEDDGVSETDIPITEIAISKEIDNILLKGATQQLEALITPENATNKTVIWSSEDSAIATVDGTGLVKGVALGEVTITVTAEDNDALSDSIVFKIVEESTGGDDSKDITSLSINDVVGDTNDYNVYVSSLPAGTAVNALTPVIVHTGVSITPSGPQDFTEPVVYTVTAEDGSTQEWTVIVFVEGSEPPTGNGSEFITTWDAREITIPTNPDFTYNYNVDWDNDGIVDQEGITGDVTHTFETSGKHTIRISGDFPAIFFGFSASNADKAKIISVDQWGTGEWLSMDRAFLRCANLTVPATDVPNLSKVTNMGLMFRQASSANPDVSQWDVSNVTNMQYMFGSATSATPDVSNWEVSNVTNMRGMFTFATLAKPDVSNWDVSNVTNMRQMFSIARSATPDVSKWVVSKVTDMGQMFAVATSANPDVSNWDVSNVTNMREMFNGAGSATPDVSNWVVSKVTDMKQMFAAATSATPDVSNWDVSNVTNMSGMFNGAGSANPDVSNWSVSNVTDMSNMFRGTGSATPDVSNWDVSNVTDMRSMFSGATSANPDVSNWKIGVVFSMRDMFKGATSFSRVNYENLLINFASQPREYRVHFDAGNLVATSTEALAARQTLINDSSWIITDGSSL